MQLPYVLKLTLCSRFGGVGSGGLGVAHPLHAVAVADLQLLLGPLEAAVLLVVGRGLEVDVDVVGGLRSRRHDCETHKTHKLKVSGAGEQRVDGRSA